MANLILFLIFSGIVSKPETVSVPRENSNGHCLCDVHFDSKDYSKEEIKNAFGLEYNNKPSFYFITSGKGLNPKSSNMTEPYEFGDPEAIKASIESQRILLERFGEIALPNELKVYQSKRMEEFGFEFWSAEVVLEYLKTGDLRVLRKSYKEASLLEVCEYINRLIESPMAESSLETFWKIDRSVCASKTPPLHCDSSSRNYFKHYGLEKNIPVIVQRKLIPCWRHAVRRKLYEGQGQPFEMALKSLKAKVKDCRDCYDASP